MAIIDKFFESKNAYIFKKNEQVSNEYLIEELSQQLRDLEVMWLRLPPTAGEENTLTLENRLLLNNITFRLKEINRFLKKNNGPKIIELVCTEIGDFIAEKLVRQTILTKEECQQVAVILSVMNTYFQPEMLQMEIVDIETISKDLKQAVNVLLERLQ